MHDEYDHCPSSFSLPRFVPQNHGNCLLELVLYCPHKHTWQLLSVPCHCFVFYAFCLHYLSQIVTVSCSVTPCSRLPGGKETRLGSFDGKVGQRSQPSTGELLKRPGEMMSWTLSFSPLRFFFFFPPSYSSGEARQQSQGFGQTHHPHEWNTRHWWLHWAEIRLPSITSLERLVMKDRISRSRSFSAFFYSASTVFHPLYFCVAKHCGTAAKFPLFWCKKQKLGGNGISQ